MRTKHYPAAFFAVLLTLALHSQTPSLLKDLYPGSDTLPLKGVTAFTAFGGNLYANGMRGTLLNTLWKVDPSGKASLFSTEMTNTNHFVELNGNLYCFRLPPDYKSELWKVDGATGKASLAVKLPANYGNFFGVPALVKVGNLLYFVGYDTDHNAELWRSDGTQAGTFLVKDINPGAESAHITNLMAFGNKVLFWAYDQPNSTPDRQVSLFISDGTDAGTLKLRAFSANDNLYFGGQNTLRLMAVAGSTAYFVANDGTNGLELWKTDGTPAGTGMVLDINPGGPNSYPNYLTAIGSQVVFYASNDNESREVWRSDGTASGTFMIKQTPGPQGIPITADRIPGVESPMVLLNNQVWFLYATRAPSDPGFTIEVCRSTGTPATTQTVKSHQTTDAGVGTDPTLVYSTLLGAVGNQMIWLFKDNLSTTKFELWKSDGSNPEMIQSGLQSVVFQPGQSAGNALFFVLDLYERTLWRTDGTALGTFPVTTTRPKGSHPDGFVRADNRTYFRTDESPDLTANLPRRKGIAFAEKGIQNAFFSEETANPVVYSSPVSVGGAVYFIKNDPAALQSALYKTSATQLVPLITGQPWNAAPYQQQQPVVHKNKIYFVRDNQIWESDGTGAGTVLYFKPPPNSNAPNYEWRAGEMVSNGDSLYFILYNQNLTGPYTTGDLWSISGNPGDPGTPLLKTVYQAINGGGGFGGRLTVLSQVNGHAILKAETVAGAGGNHFSGPVTLYSPGFAQFSTGSQTVNNGGFVYTSAIIDNRFYVLSKEEIFSFYDPPVFKNELWVTQSFGPKLLLKKFASRPDGVGKHFGVLGNRVFFAADDSTGLGQELWYSDGTPGGTVLVKDIHPGAGDAKIGAFASDGLHVYFPAFDGNTWALWRSDGTPGGTTKVANFPTTSIETPIKNLFFNQKTLYFSGNDGTTGDEPWAMEIPSNPADRPDLELSIRHRLSHLLIPGIIDLEVKVKNRGTGPATGVKVKFAPPVGFTFPVDLVNRQLEIDLGTIKSGDSVVQVLSYLTRIPATATSREYFLFAQISAQNEPDTDSSPNSVPCNSGICTPVEDDEARIYAPDSAPCDLAVSLVSAHCDPGKLPEISDNTYDYTINVTGSTPGLGFGWFRSLYGGGERLQDEAIALHYTIPDMASANFLAFFDNNNPRCPLVNLSLEYLSLPCQFVPTTEAASAIGFSLSPNPATRSVSLQWLDTDIREARGSIVNPLGQTVKTFPLTGAQGIPTTIDLSGLGSGLYWVRVEVPGRGSGVKRLVVAE